MRLARLEARKSSAFRGLYRSKGLFWLASRPHLAGQWAQAGTVLALEGVGLWQSEPEQELVLIGNFEGEERSNIEAELNACLLTDDEMDIFVQSKFEDFPDPFLPWTDPAQEEESSSESSPKRSRIE